MENLQAYYYNFQQFFFLPNKFDAFNTVSEFFVFFFFPSLWLHLWHMEVPGLGVESEL